MDLAEMAIEGAGLALVGLLMTGMLAAVGERRRLVFGICLGLGVGLFVLPFVAYLVARVTNHQATNMDLTPPAYIVVTALTCVGCALSGAICGAIAETRHSGRQQRLDALRRARHTDPDAQYRDDPHEWLPWGKRDWPQP